MTRLSGSARFTSQGKVLVASALLVLLSTWLFLPSVQFDFVDLMDDSYYVLENPMVHDAFSWESLRRAFCETYAASYQPLVWVSFMLDHKLFGMDPMGYHLENVLWHALNAALVFLVLHSAAGGFWRCFLAALFFAIHPLRVESVAWITERKDVLSTFFILVALLFYIQWAKKGRLWAYILMAFAFVLSLMVKAMAVTFPALLLLFDYWPLRRLCLESLPGGAKRTLRQCCSDRSVRAILVEKLPLLGISLFFVAATLLGAKSDASTVGLDRLPILARLINACVSISEYFRKTVFPFDLAPLYPHPWWWPWPIAIVAVLFVLACSFGVIWVRRSQPFLFSGWFFFTIALLPVIGFVQSGTQAMADRFTYLPGIGLIWAIVWAMEAATRRISRPLVAVLVAGTAILFGSLTRDYLPVWSNSGTVFERAAKMTEGNYVAHLNVSVWHLKRGNFELALPHLLALARIRPQDPARYVNIGVALAALGRTDAARAAYEKALSLGETSGDAYYNLGILFEQMNRAGDAEHAFAEAFRRNPAKPSFGQAYARSLAKTGKTAEALDVIDGLLKSGIGWHPEVRPMLLETKSDIEKYASGGSY